MDFGVGKQTKLSGQEPWPDFKLCLIASRASWGKGNSFLFILVYFFKKIHSTDFSFNVYFI